MLHYVELPSQAPVVGEPGCASVFEENGQLLLIWGKLCLVGAVELCCRVRIEWIWYLSTNERAEGNNQPYLSIATSSANNPPESLQSNLLSLENDRYQSKCLVKRESSFGCKNFRLHLLSEVPATAD
jgi:hypothetical protein